MTEARWSWLRTVMNGYEPDNVITFIGVPDPDGQGEERGLVAIECYAYCVFKDGPTDCGVRLIGPNQFSWWNGERRGIEATFAEAFDELPALVTFPDHYEDREPERLIEIRLPGGGLEWVPLEVARHFEHQITDTPKGDDHG